MSTAVNLLWYQSCSNISYLGTSTIVIIPICTVHRSLPLQSNYQFRWVVLWTSTAGCLTDHCRTHIHNYIVIWVQGCCPWIPASCSIRINDLSTAEHTEAPWYFEFCLSLSFLFLFIMLLYLVSYLNLIRSWLIPLIVSILRFNDLILHFTARALVFFKDVRCELTFPYWLFASQTAWWISFNHKYRWMTCHIIWAETPDSWSCLPIFCYSAWALESGSPCVRIA